MDNKRRSNNNNHKSLLIRSLSFSNSPVTEKIVVEQLYHQNRDGDVLVQKYSCEKFYDYPRKALQLNKAVVIRRPFVEELPKPKQQEDKKINETSPPKFECTPMEVDTSTEDETTETPIIKKSNETPNSTLVKKWKQKPTKFQSYIKYLKISIIILIPIILAYLLKKSYNLHVSDQFQVQNITKTLKNLIYGQDEAITKIRTILTEIEDKNVLIFTGGIGVGKTYTAHLISTNFPSKNNVQKIMSYHLKNKYNELSLFKNSANSEYNLIIVDGLEIGDQTNSVKFAKKMLNLKQKVILILIFNTPQYSFDNTKQSLNVTESSDLIHDTFDNANIKHTMILFKELNEDVVRKCIRYAMTKRRLVITEHNIQFILRNIDYKYSGCKGVYSKVALLR